MAGKQRSRDLACKIIRQFECASVCLSSALRIFCVLAISSFSGSSDALIGDGGDANLIALVGCKLSCKGRA